MRRSILSDPKTMASIGVRTLLWYTPLRRFTFYRYWYNFTPEQLAFFVRCINRTRKVPGDIVEVGCANGHTACFLSRHLQAAGISKDYYCIDTFDGFTARDTTFEVTRRGKKPTELGGFRSNSLKWLEYTLKRNSCKRTYGIQADIETHEFNRPISFCLVDVALYRPTLATLRKAWPMISPGGLVVVGNCKPCNSFDGAMEAFAEFTETEKITPRYVLGRLGILQKAAEKSVARRPWQPPELDAGSISLIESAIEKCEKRAVGRGA
jgi:O-methyltransferase